MPELRGSLQTFGGRIKASDGGRRGLQGPTGPRMSKGGLQVLSLDGQGPSSTFTDIDL